MTTEATIGPALRIWLARGEEEGATGRLEDLLRQLAGQPGAGIEYLGAGPDDQPGGVLVAAEGLSPQDALVVEALARGAGVVAAVRSETLRGWAELAEQQPVILVSLRTDGEGLRLALAGAAGAARRHAALRAQVEQLRRRLEDRILIERAKGVLTRKLLISEEQAYRRLRLQARKQRRAMREVARALLDTQELLELPAENLAEERST